MSSKVLRPGGEIDSWCTKCLLVLGHRIVAVVDNKPVKVECLTCRSTHMFRAQAPGAKSLGKARKDKDDAPASKRSSSTLRSVGVRASDRDKAWENATNGKSTRDFTPYATTSVFTEGQLIRHPKFGDGLVQRLVDSHKIEVLFQNDTRILIHGVIVE